jgi:hypothetical protein
VRAFLGISKYDVNMFPFVVFFPANADPDSAMFKLLRVGARGRETICASEPEV